MPYTLDVLQNITLSIPWFIIYVSSCIPWSVNTLLAD